MALVLSGGGARAAYQVGFLRHLTSELPEIAPGNLTGVSAGGIIAAHIAAREGTLPDSVHGLSALWQALQIEDVFSVDPRELASRVTRWGFRLVSGGATAPSSKAMRPIFVSKPSCPFATKRRPIARMRSPA